MSHNSANQNHSPEERQFTPDQLAMNKRRLEVIHSVGVVELTARARGITSESSKTAVQQETYHVNGNVIDAAALFAHNKRVAAEELAIQQLADERFAREAVLEANQTAQNPTDVSQQSNVVDAAHRFQPLKVQAGQLNEQLSARAKVEASFSDVTQQRAA